MSADREPGGADLRDAMREKIAALEAQVRVWRHLAETGSILSRGLGVVGVDEGAKALGALLQRSTRHANQGAKAMREKCALAMVAGASPEDLRALPLPTPAEIMQVAKAEIAWPKEG